MIDRDITDLEQDTNAMTTRVSLYAVEQDQSEAETTHLATVELPAELTKYRVLPPRQAAQVLGISEATLERLRASNKAPRAVLLSERRIGYRLSDIESWLEARST